MGITPRTVHFYTEEGVIKPSIHNPKGRGTTRLYGRQDIMELAVALELGEVGFTVRDVRHIMAMPRIILEGKYDPWDPDSEESPGKDAYLVVVDAHKERGLAACVAYKRDEFGPIDMGEGRMFHINGKPTPYNNLVAINLTAVRRRVQGVL